jgi:hypothetical protein
LRPAEPTSRGAGLRRGHSALQVKIHKVG